MSIPVSTVPTVMSYLVASVGNLASTDPDEILVKLGDPVKEMPNDVIEFGTTARQVKWETFTGSGGQFALYETYDITCDVSSWIPYSDDFNTTEVALQVNSRAWQLVAYVETTIRTDPSLGGVVEIAYPRSSNASKPTPDDLGKGLLVAISLPIHVESFI